MGTSRNSNSDRVVEDFIQSLEATTDLVQRLLEDIREGEVDFASIKTELRILVQNVKDLSSSIKGSDIDISHLRTKIAVLEKSVSELESWMKFKKQKEEQDSVTLKIADKTGRWQTIAAVTTGILALLTASATLIINLLMK
jgi:chromosome segregation ATPase